MVRGASLGRGAGRAGIAWSGRASTGAVSAGAGAAVPPLDRLEATAGYSVLTAWPPNSLRNAASTLAP